MGKCRNAPEVSVQLFSHTYFVRVSAFVINFDS